jgi:hypothetical protein
MMASINDRDGNAVAGRAQLAENDEVRRVWID